MITYSAVRKTGYVPIVKSCCSRWPLASFIMLPLLPLENKPLESRLRQCISRAHQSLNPYSAYSYIYIFLLVYTKTNHTKNREMFIISKTNLLWNSLWRCSEKSLQANWFVIQESSYLLNCIFLLFCIRKCLVVKSI